MEEKDIFKINSIVQKKYEKNINQLIARTFILGIFGVFGAFIAKLGISELTSGTYIESYSSTIAIALLFPLCVTWVVTIKKETDILIKKREILRAKLINLKLGGSYGEKD